MFCTISEADLTAVWASVVLNSTLLVQCQCLQLEAGFFETFVEVAILLNVSWIGGIQDNVYFVVKGLPVVSYHVAETFGLAVKREDGEILAQYTIKAEYDNLCFSGGV